VALLAVAVLCLTLGVAGASGPAPGQPSDLVAMRFFTTPGGAAYCYLGRSLAPENPVLGCWTPNDGFVATVAHDADRGRAGYQHEEIFRGHRPPRYRVLGFGERFLWRCLSVDDAFAERCSPTRGEVVFRCASRRSGLTCVNQDRHGFRLGRPRGHRTF
jgi:hypothetical protein